MISDATINRLRMIHRTALQDTCVRLVHTPQVTNPYGVPAVEYVEGDPLPCLFRAGNRQETLAQSHVPAAQARLHLPVNTVLAAADRIRLTHLHGEALAEPEDYEVVGPPRLTWVGLEVALKLVS